MQWAEQVVKSADTSPLHPAPKHAASQAWKMNPVGRSNPVERCGPQRPFPATGGIFAVIFGGPDPFALPGIRRIESTGRLIPARAIDFRLG